MIRMTALFMDEQDLEALDSIVERIGHLVVADVDPEDLPAIVRARVVHPATCPAAG